MRRVLLALVLLASASGAQDLDAQKRTLDEERRANQLRRSASEEARSDLARPAERVRDPKVCEDARVYYQLACGAPYSARSRSMRCTEAELAYRQSC
jgi:hypothetical protein